jgi:hypothetical protein
LVSPHTLLRLPLRSLPLLSPGFPNTPLVWLSLGGSGGRGIPFLVGLGSILSWVSETHHQKAWAQVTHSPRPIGSLANHLNSVTTDSHVFCVLSDICAARGRSTVHNILLFHSRTGSLKMGASTSSLPSYTPLRCLLNNLDTLGLTPDVKPKNLIHFCTQIWPTYPLDNQNHWPLFGFLDPNLLWDI